MHRVYSSTSNVAGECRGTAAAAWYQQALDQGLLMAWIMQWRQQMRVHNITFFQQPQKTYYGDHDTCGCTSSTLGLMEPREWIDLFYDMHAAALELACS